MTISPLADFTKSPVVDYLNPWNLGSTEISIMNLAYNSRKVGKTFGYNLVMFACEELLNVEKRTKSHVKRVKVHYTYLWKFVASD